MENYNNLSKEELIALLLETKDALNRQIADQDKEIKRQNKEIEELRSDRYKLSMRIEELIAKYENKVSELNKERIEKFIPKSEKLKDEDLVINELECIKESKKRRTPTENFVSDLKKAYTGEPIIMDYDFEGNGVDRSLVKPFGIDETWKVEYRPSSFEITKYEKPKYKDKDHIYMNSFDDDPFPHSPLTPSLASNILTMKYELAVPFYRYAGYLNTLGLKVSDADIAHWAGKSAELLEPVYEAILDRVLHPETDVLHIDETPLKVIDSDKSKCYVFVYATPFYESPAYLYRFVDGRSTADTKELLKDYKGYVVCDGYGGYDSLSDMGIKIQRCMVHARRYFADTIKALPDKEKKTHPAYNVLTIMSKIFEFESKFKEKKYTPSKIMEERNKPYYLDHIKKLDRYIDSLDPKEDTLLSKAIQYYKNNRKELYTYLENGYVDISNNLAERVVKPFVIARKNFLFCKSINGAEATSKLFSIIQTARANGLIVEKYLSYCLSHINKEPLDNLLPWSTKLPDEIYLK